MEEIKVIYGIGKDFRMMKKIMKYWMEEKLIVFEIIIEINVKKLMDGIDMMNVEGLGVNMVGIELIGEMGMKGMKSRGIGEVDEGGIIGFEMLKRKNERIFIGD